MTKSAADRLVQIACKECQLFRTKQNEFFARYQVGDHKEIHFLDTTEFRRWLEAMDFAKTGASLPPSALDQAIATLSAHARVSGKPREVYRRVAFQDGAYYIDLCDDRWCVARVDESGWRILKKSSVLFTRSASSSALPRPAKGGSFERILDVANIPEKYLIVILTWIIECFRPNTPYVGISISGPQGSAKSSTQDFLKSLIDPSDSNRRAKPKSREDLFVAANRGHLLSYENLSALRPEIQDAMCIMSTGGSFSSRKFYSNGDEYTVYLKNPIILNGIVNTVTRPDLLDRMLCIELRSLRVRMTETELFEKCDQLRGLVFGAVLDRFSEALRILPDIQSEKGLQLPRMADFAQLGEAVARTYGKKPGWFLSAYARLRRGSVANALDGDPVAVAIRSFLSQRIDLYGPLGVVSETLHEHWKQMPGTQIGGERWPGSGKAFANELRRLEPPMELIGISIKFGKRTRDGYTCSIRKAVA